MIHATSSPSVAYAYVYALPGTGIDDASSAYDEGRERARHPREHEREQDRRTRLA